MERQTIRIPDVIQKKRDKCELEPEEIRFFIREMVKGCIEPVQLGKFQHENYVVIPLNILIT
jgi:thymidine phosphorylase